MLEEIFSEENVKIFLFEDRIKNSNTYFDEICLFIKTENFDRSYSDVAINITRKKELINIFLAK